MARTINDSDDTIPLIYGITNPTDRKRALYYFLGYLYFDINKVALDICPFILEVQISVSVKLKKEC